MRLKKITKVLLLSAALSGCGILPNPGPSGSVIKNEAKHKNISVITVTPIIASKMRTSLIDDQKLYTDKNLELLRHLSRKNISTILLPGDMFSLQMFIMPLLPSGNSSGGSDLVRKVYYLRNNIIDDNGSATIPFAGTVYLSGKTLRQAELTLKKVYKEKRIFTDPQLLIHIQKNRGQSVFVTGHTINPTRISWRPGGITLADALVESKGFNDGGYAHNKSSIGKDRTVFIHEDGKTIILPEKTAESTQIALLPGAVVALRLQVNDHIFCMGGGLTANRDITFSKTPSLATVVSRAGGLNPQTARAESVFVLSPNHKVVYRFYLNKLSGLQAAQDFPVRNRSIVYVSTASSVRLQQAMQILFSPFYPAAAIKGVA